MTGWSPEVASPAMYRLQAAALTTIPKMPAALSALQPSGRKRTWSSWPSTNCVLLLQPLKLGEAKFALRLFTDPQA